MTDDVELRARYCPCCDSSLAKGFRPGPGGRPEALCPRCRSLERHRFLALLVQALAPLLTDVGVLLDISPAPAAQRSLTRLRPRTYVRLDIAAARDVDLRGDLTALPIRDEAVDLIHCFHVLEHIPDDRAAIAELCRVLAPTGLGLVQVPWRAGRVTEEDPGAPPEERARRFGLADHVRSYGDDFEDRLTEGGLTVTRVTPRQFVGEPASRWLGLGQVQSVWLVRKAAVSRSGNHGPATSPAPSPDISLAGPFQAVLTELAQAQARVRELRRENQLLPDRISTGEPAGPRRVGRLLRGVRHRLRHAEHRG